MIKYAIHCLDSVLYDLNADRVVLRYKHNLSKDLPVFENNTHRLFLCSSLLIYPNEQLNVQVTIQNDSIYAAEEVVQLYIESEYYSVSRPVDELKAFKRIKFNPHETKQVDFVLTMNDFRSYNMNMIWTAEISKYQIKVGPSSSEKLSQSIEIKDF